MKNKSSNKNFPTDNSQFSLNGNSEKTHKRRKRNKKLKKLNTPPSDVQIAKGHISGKKKRKGAVEEKSSEHINEISSPVSNQSLGSSDFTVENVSKRRKKTKTTKDKDSAFKAESHFGVKINKENKLISGEKDNVTIKKKKHQHNIEKLGINKESEDKEVPQESIQKRKKKKNRCLNTASNKKLGKDNEAGEIETYSSSEDEEMSQRVSNEFDLDSYPSDSDEEVGELPPKINFADYSSDDSSSVSSENESDHSFDADSYPSDTEDEDEKKKGLPKNAVPSAELEEREKRTVFVGNLPKNVERHQLKKWFFKFGKVECVRLRSAPIADPELPRRVAVIKKTFHEDRSNIHAYIRFKTIEAAKNALQANGAIFKDYVIRVDSSINKGKHDSNKAVFVGNVPFSLEEDAMRKFFLDCGDIDNVRIIRDKNTGVGKGFAYVNFKCSTSVPLALKLDGEVLEKRELRVKPIKYPKKNAKTFLKRPAPQYHSKKFYNKSKADKAKKENKFQGEISEKKIKKHPKRKTAEERKREKFSKILNSKSRKNE